MKKKILLLVPDDYRLYVLIERNLKQLGFEVTTILHNSVKFRYKNISQRLSNLFRKVLDGNTNYKKKLKEIHTAECLVKEIDMYDQFDYCLVMRADFFHEDVLLKAKEKSNFIVSYHYDGLGRNPSIYDRIPLFDRFYVFDEEDLISDGKVKTCLSHNFYFDDDGGEGRDPVYDLYFLGFYNETREELLLRFFDLAKRCLGNVKFQIVFLPKDVDRMPEYERRGIECLIDLVPFEEYLQRVEQAKVIVDFVISDHKGLSFRIFEGLKYQKKIITTNASVVKYDFYTPKNFYVLNYDTLNETELLKFVNNPFNPIDDSVRLRYSFSHWIKEVLNIK
ncbi:hypothetical protein [Sphingobacterium haloxyli]|uniref:Lipopolysaccharide biosynthesis protein n=1 Tax=Sphingobacterium haloxyli TaxID=2100533 RepID=A0A2S9J0C4_9SPHI|nr:hypothetical protein [Sphingobacterium haloxyli]PRD46222.1 hypothetical protein C5745_16590 [Sphingobacterium haloxyli]